MNRGVLSLRTGDNRGKDSDILSIGQNVRWSLIIAPYKVDGNTAGMIRHFNEKYLQIMEKAGIINIGSILRRIAKESSHSPPSLHSANG